MPLNADEVLKSLVERKCRLQSMETFSVERTTEVLHLILTVSFIIDHAYDAHRCNSPFTTC